MNNLGAIDNARSEAQRRNMEDTIGKGLCTFCDGKGFDSTINKVIWSGKYFRLWHNPFAYENTEIHIVIAPHEHLTDIAELTPAMWIEWGMINQKMISDLNMPGGGIVMRFGDTAFNGGTLRHLHSHIAVPNLMGPLIALFAHAHNDEQAIALAKKLVKKK